MEKRQCWCIAQPYTRGCSLVVAEPGAGRRRAGCRGHVHIAKLGVMVGEVGVPWLGFLEVAGGEEIVRMWQCRLGTDPGGSWS